MSADKVGPPYGGSCLCGAVKYSVDNIGNAMAHCHCAMCRKFHGAAFATFGAAAIENFRWLAGEEKFKTYLAGNGTKRLFCDNCGSSMVFVTSNDTGEFVEFTLGTLDSEVPNKPDAHIFTEYSACWHDVSDELPQFSEGRGSAIKE